VPGLVELAFPGRPSGPARALAALAASDPLWLMPHGVERGVRAMDEVERIANDDRFGEHRSDCEAVRLVGINRDDLDRFPPLVGQQPQVALDRAAAASLDHLDHAAPVNVRDDDGELVATTVMGLVERDPPRHRSRACGELAGRPGPEGTVDPVAARPLVASDPGGGRRRRGRA
jgi:hypothetical protein